jgi:hypothetical protein
MSRMLAFFCLFLLAAGGLAACSKSDDNMSIDSIKSLPTGQPDPHESERRPPPASSGLSSDPFNPNGAPGPSTGLGTSSSRS